MSSVTNTELESLTGFQILEATEDQDIYTLIFQTKSVQWACVADRQILQKLGSSIRKRVGDPDEEKS